jgi:hypothetical protein
MSTVSVSGDECASRALIGWWFRQLDQRRICHGAREWAVQVTAIVDEEDALWIQIADEAPRAGSVLLRLRSTASVEQAVAALNSRSQTPASYPVVINTCLPPRELF